MTDVDVIKFEHLLKDGGQVNIGSVMEAFKCDERADFRPLRMAAEHGRADVIRLLASVGDFRGNEPAVVLAISKRHVNVLFALVEIGATVGDAAVRAAVATQDDVLMHMVLRAREDRDAARSACLIH